MRMCRAAALETKDTDQAPFFLGKSDKSYTSLKNTDEKSKARKMCKPRNMHEANAQGVCCLLITPKAIFTSGTVTDSQNSSSNPLPRSLS